jgi:hypothetical protein
MAGTRHGRTTMVLAGGAVLLVVLARVTAGTLSLAVAVLAAAVAASLVTHEALGPAEVAPQASARHSQRGSSSAA